MSFWDWALAAYARPGVADSCLELQDDHGQCVPYLLWAAWAAADGRPLSAQLLAQGAALARAWEATAVGPLRQARRRLKSPLVGLDDGAREAVRRQVKAAELAAERAVMDALQALSPSGSGPALPLAPALTDAARASGSEPPLQALRALAQNLAGR
jgi:uncharacterized protein (TIGR02444 family)